MRHNNSSGLLIFIVAVISLVAGSAVTALYMGKGSAGAVASGGGDIEAAVRKVLEDKPELISEAFQKGRARAQVDQMKKARENVSANIDKIEKNDKSPIAGNPKGDVVVAEFFDYSCGYCKHAVAEVVKLLEEDKNVKFVFKDYPILGPGSETASRAALAVHVIDPTKYFAYHRALMEFQGQKTEDSVLEVAKKLGLDTAKIKETMKGAQVTELLQANTELGHSIGVNGTPAFIINGELVPGAMSVQDMKTMIAEARKKKS